MIYCALCGTLMKPLISAYDYRRPTDRTKYILNWCDKCKFGRLAGEFTPLAVRDFFDIPYYTHAQIRSGSEGTSSDKGSLWAHLRCHLAWRVDNGSDFQVGELGESSGRTVCDIGCGNGRVLEALKNGGFHVTGIEPDQRARSSALKVLQVFDGTAEQLPPQIRGTRFDIVLLLHVLDACIDLHAAMKNICSILRPAGSVIIEVPNFAAKGFAKFGPVWPWSDIPRHINFFTERSLTALLQSYGFEISRTRYVGFFRQFTPGWIETQNLVWDAVGTGSRPNFDLAAWCLLAETAFARPSRKYDSVRVLASCGR
jgi:SAM-dependent methyltransferase